MTDPVTPDPTQAAPVPPAAPAYAPGAPAYAPAPVGPKTNTLAIVGLVVSFFVTVGGIVIGAIALGQIKRTGEGGRGLAIAAIIVGSVLTLFWVIYIIAAIVVAVSYGTAVNSLSNY